MRSRRVVLCAALVLGFTTAPAAVGTPVAGATAVDCHFYLWWKGFSGVIIDSGCGFGEDGAIETCEMILGYMNVTPPEVVKEACRLAALP
jgi:hypothetical protein